MYDIDTFPFGRLSSSKKIVELFKCLTRGAEAEAEAEAAVAGG